jgi:4-aminobutyrate aminotransferase-like enzyme
MLLKNQDAASGPATHQAYDMADLFARRERDRYALHGRHLNEQLVRVLKAIGYDVGFVRGKGQYLYDRAGSRYLDLLSGYGVPGAIWSLGKTLIGHAMRAEAR